MLSARSKSLPLLASMAAIAVTAPAFAQDQKVASNDVTSAVTECRAKFGDSDQAVNCAVNAVQADTARLKSEEVRLKSEQVQLKQEGDAAQAATDCIKFLTAGVKSGAFNKAEILQRAGGKLNVTNACPTAKAYGFGRKAEAGAPRLN